LADKNNDGLLSQDEGFINENVSRHWDKLDTDLDGNLDKAGFAKLESVVKREESLKPIILKMFNWIIRVNTLLPTNRMGGMAE
jgi:hypothetical protein